MNKVNFQGHTALHIAFQHKQVLIDRALRNPIVSKQPTSPLHPIVLSCRVSDQRGSQTLSRKQKVTMSKMRIEYERSDLTRLRILFTRIFHFHLQCSVEPAKG